MKILNSENKVIGQVDQDKKENGQNIPFSYRYTGKGLTTNYTTFPIRANSESAACNWACKYFGDGTTYLLFTI